MLLFGFIPSLVTVTAYFVLFFYFISSAWLHSQLDGAGVGVKQSMVRDQLKKERGTSMGSACFNTWRCGIKEQRLEYLGPRSI